jgi:hypothetical protein
MLVNSFIYLRDADQFTKVYHEFSEMAAQVDKEDSIAKGPGLEELAKTAAMKKSSDHARSSGSKTSTAIGGDLKAKPKENGINRGERTSLMSDNDDLQKNDGDKSDHHRKSQKFDQESSESEDNSPSKQSQSPRKQSSPFTSTPFEDDDNDMQSFPKSRSFNSEPRSPHGPRDFEQDFDGDDGDLNNDFPPAVGGRKRNTYDDRDNIETNDDD